MATTGRCRLPIPTAAEPADRVLTPEQKRELTIDTMASWALEGLEPTRQTVENINAYLRGEVRTDGIPAQVEGEVTPAAGQGIWMPPWDRVDA